MRTADEVDKLVEDYKAEGLTPPEIIARIAPECLGWPYVFGAWGELCTPANRRKRVRDDHPTIRSACQVLSGKSGSCDGCKWYPGGKNVRMYDCRGFTAWLCQQVGITLSGGGATGQWNDTANWMRRGDIGDMPNVVCCLFKRVDNKMEHTGMHIGDGRVIHCSHNVEEGTTSKGWTHYAIPKGLYREDEIPHSTTHRTIKRGSQGGDVKECQVLLTRKGYDPGEPDGVFGKKTEAAVKAFQKDNGLTADGIVGPKTWAALETPTVLYDVEIKGVSAIQVKQILADYPDAIVTEEGD